MDEKPVMMGKITLYCLLLVQVSRLATAENRDTVLRCYDCLNTFKKVWNPYTDCQINATAVSIATCLDTDKFCKVERVTVKGITIKIARSCAGDCYYGCTFYGFGVTQLRCTSCCNQSLCNTGSGAAAGPVFTSPTPRLWKNVPVLVCVTFALNIHQVL